MLRECIRHDHLAKVFFQFNPSDSFVHLFFSDPAVPRVVLQLFLLRRNVLIRHRVRCLRHFQSTIFFFLISCNLFLRLYLENDFFIAVFFSEDNVSGSDNEAQDVVRRVSGRKLRSILRQVPGTAQLRELRHQKAIAQSQNLFFKLIFFRKKYRVFEW